MITSRPLSRRRRRIFFRLAAAEKIVRLTDRRRICASAAAAEKYSAKPTVLQNADIIFGQGAELGGLWLGFTRCRCYLLFLVCDLYKSSVACHRLSMSRIVTK